MGIKDFNFHLTLLYHISDECKGYKAQNFTLPVVIEQTTTNDILYKI